MRDKYPQSTEVLVTRLRRVARALDGLAAGDDHGREVVAWRAFANTCLQAAGRLEALAAVVVMVDIQACDDGLWFQATSATEAYLQRELRALHRLIEKAAVTPNHPESARRTG